MYKKANKSLWKGRVDKEDKELGKRWHQKIKFIKPPFKKEKAITLLGFACDEGVKRNKGRIGSVYGSDILKSFMGNFAYGLKNYKLFDAGKIVATNELEKSQEVLASYITKLLKKNHFPILLGGGHEIAYSSFLGLFNFLEHKQNIAIINFDAHFDLRDEKEASSGTPFSQIATLCKKNKIDFNYMCLGISKASNTKALFKKAKNLNVNYILDTKITYLNFQKIINKLEVFLSKKEYIYITIDTDVFSASCVPAVSSPASRGIELNITYDILSYIFKNYQNKIKLVDVAEFNPKYDISDIGAKSISRLVFDIVDLIDSKFKL